jgi:hypothetical protein
VGVVVGTGLAEAAGVKVAVFITLLGTAVLAALVGGSGEAGLQAEINKPAVRSKAMSFCIVSPPYLDAIYSIEVVWINSNYTPTRSKCFCEIPIGIP